jgi:antitoxin PrlF
MSSLLEAESTLTDRYQTTVPDTVRRALSLGKRDKIRYTIRPDGAVVLTRAADAAEDDPVISNFLDFLARDMAANPQRVSAINAEFAKRIQLLVADVQIDIESALAAEDE